MNDIEDEAIITPEDIGAGGEMEDEGTMNIEVAYSADQQCEDERQPIKGKERQSTPQQLISLQCETISAINALVNVQKDLMLLERRRLLIETERLAIEKERLAVDKTRCVLVPADGASCAYQVVMTGNPKSPES